MHTVYRLVMVHDLCPFLFNHLLVIVDLSLVLLERPHFSRAVQALYLDGWNGLWSLLAFFFVLSGFLLPLHLYSLLIL